MPKLSKIFSRSDKEKEALAEAERNNNNNTSGKSSSPPPGYAEPPPDYDEENVEDPPDITAGFSNLNFREVAKGGFPTPAQCIAHLKVLECFYRLRQKIGSADGLYGINDKIVLGHSLDNNDKTSELLAKFAEKRWAVFVAQAVDRFEAWCTHLMPNARAITIDYLESEGPKGNLCEPEGAELPLKFDRDNMPPVDVLMVWHAYMLNPRAYLEDCLRNGMMQLWHTRFPWQAVADCINSDTFAYQTSETAEVFFKSLTGYSWDSLATPCQKESKCPACRRETQIPWTSCSENAPSGKIKSYEDLSVAIDAMLASGNGYCDKDLSLHCPSSSCGTNITHERLRAAKFLSHVHQLLENRVPMGGTILGGDGIPCKVGGYTDINGQIVTHNVNQFLLKGLGQTMLRPERLNDPGASGSMEGIRDTIQLAVADRRYLLKVKLTRLSRAEKVTIRKMMSRYWENSSPFALDLVGAVIRQGSFIEKMHNIDWLHSPALPSTMARLITKYGRFMNIMTDRYNMAVPTLDVDLAWHTHQLHPYAYLRYTVAETKQFIDHDDKVAETKLNDAFAWTSKTYQKKFGEPYSECTCWYCEAVRESHTSAASRLFNTSSAQVRDQVHDVEQDPRKSVHISAHNAVRPTDDSNKYQADATLKANALEKHYQKACERARKKGRKEPRRDDYYYSDAWGYPVYIPAYSPYIGYTPYSVGYYPMNPGCMALGTGAAGNCAAGTCGGGAAAGACGAGSGGCAGGAAGGCGGGGGGGGGGCGGGGGGGCGGGGGG